MWYTDHTLIDIFFYRTLNKDLHVDVNKECLSPYCVQQYVNPLHCGETLCLSNLWTKRKQQMLSKVIYIHYNWP